jgi:16S rRNA (cytosine1402-N4)-methyltransferase
MSVATHNAAGCGAMFVGESGKEDFVTKGGWGVDLCAALCQGVTPAAAALLREQDFKPAGAAFPLSVVSVDWERMGFMTDTLSSVQSPRRIGRVLGRSSRSGFAISSSRQEVSGDRQEQIRSGVENHPVQECDELERFAVAYHKPVLPREVRERLAPASGRWFLDMTLGGAGHTEMLLESGGSVVGIDQDEEALMHASMRLARYGRRFRAIHGSFGAAVELIEVARRSQANADLPERFDGVLMDLGVSSHQLDAAERGFSFMREGPLDMRMNLSEGTDAAAVVNTYSESELVRIFREFGEEPSARRIARMILDRRSARPFVTTVQLAAAIEEVVPRRGRAHPATRVFQALRMEVNHELEVLERGLVAARTLLAPGGTLAVISFHSLEDRIVKHFMRQGSIPEIDRPEWPAPRRNPDHAFVRGGGRHQEPQQDEVAWNPRSRSAKLRCVEKLRASPRAQ